MKTLRMYLVDLLKNVDQDITISDDAKLYIEKILVIMCDLIYEKAAIVNAKNLNKTINQNAIRIAVRMMYTGEMQTILIKEIHRSLNDGKNSMVFPTSFFSTPNYKLTNKGLIAITSVMEYVAYDILSVACVNVILNNKTRICSNDIYDAIWSDAELTSSCIKNNIFLMRRQAPSLPKRYIENFIQQCSPSLRCNKDVIASLTSYMEEYIRTIVYQQKIVANYDP